ncbi:MAG: pyridoxal phosphate-dependent aminotransferase [Sphaerochaetaceae bacterium]|nr:pyridoxal phosphate-dependent aminotransferase [Sphaerochaetaceae bacterium]
MKYDFDTLCNRIGTQCEKWDNIPVGALPMWVADMDFKTVPEVTKAIVDRASTGITGYSMVSQSWYEAIVSWNKRRHNIEYDKDWILFSSGVVPSVSCAIRRFSQPGEYVLIQSPVYHVFYSCIENNGRRVLDNCLVYENGTYKMDLEDLDKKLACPTCSLMILCNPHNPIGKIWDKDTLIEVAALCKKHNVVLVSDEIHCDLVDPNLFYVPFLGVSSTAKEVGISLLAPTKTFNLAGIQTSYVVVPNEKLRGRMNRQLNGDDVGEPNAFATIAATEAMNNGSLWLDELRDYIYGNKNLVATFLQENLPNVGLTVSDATYLVWLDVSSYTNDSKALKDFLIEKASLVLNSGSSFRGNGNTFLRMNLATQRTNVEEGLRRLKKGLDLWKSLKKN